MTLEYLITSPARLADFLAGRILDVLTYSLNPILENRLQRAWVTYEFTPPVLELHRELAELHALYSETEPDHPVVEIRIRSPQDEDIFENNEPTVQHVYAAAR
jgi:hypothetical protein